MQFTRRLLSIFMFVVLIATVFIAPTAYAQEEVEPSEGCVTLDGSSEVSDGLSAVTFGPVDLVEGEVVSFTVTGGDGDVTFDLSVNGDLVSENNALGNTVTYPITVDDAYTFTIEASSPGSVDVTIAVMCEALEDEEGEGGAVTICHYPPGNPENAKTLTVGAPAVDAHVRNHGDTIGPCSEEEETENPDPENGLVIVVLPESGSVEVYGECGEEGCTLLAVVELAVLNTSIDEEGLLFDEDPTDDYEVYVFYLGYQDRDGDGEFADVYQVNIFSISKGEFINDDTLLLQLDDGTWIWDSNSNSTPRE